MKLVIEAFCTALKDHLTNNVAAFTERRTLDDGCSTCGYDATVVYALDMDKLFQQIDEFGAKLVEKQLSKQGMSYLVGETTK